MTLCARGAGLVSNYYYQLFHVRIVVIDACDYQFEMQLFVADYQLL